MAAGQDRRPGRGPGQRGRPQRGFLQVAADGDELRLPAGRYRLPGDPGRSLDAQPADLGRQVQAPGQRRLAGAGPQPAPAGPPGRVNERRRHAAQVGVPDVPVLEPHLAGDPVGRRVGLGHPQVQRVGVHRQDLVLAGQRDQVTADAAAQVG